jgi:predicted GNAT superfamily acetyltransferase
MPEFEIRPLRTLDDFRAAEDVQRDAWQSDELDIVPLHMLLTVAKNGGVALGAFAPGATSPHQLVGFVFGFLGTGEHRYGPEAPAAVKLKHCSHQMGVLPAWQSKGVGYALKVAQREAVRGQGLRLITWTYDLLESKNAHLNISKLGAVCRTYYRDLYGALRDGLNRGFPTDRFQVDWWIDSNRVETRLTQNRPPLTLKHYRFARTPIINEAAIDARGLPVCPDPIGPAVPGANAERFLVEFPADFQAIRRADPDLALAWRLHLRLICEDAFKRGYSVIDYIYEPGPPARSYYLMQQLEFSEA